MNKQVDPVIRQILSEFGFVSHVQRIECSQCHKEANCVEFKLLGWLCQECEDFLTDPPKED